MHDDFRCGVSNTCFRNTLRLDHATIVAVAQRRPEGVVQEDANLLMYYDNALMRSETA